MAASCMSALSLCVQNAMDSYNLAETNSTESEQGSLTARDGLTDRFV